MKNIQLPFGLSKNVCSALFAAFVLCACSTSSKQVVMPTDLASWQLEIINYKEQLSPDSPDHTNQLLAVTSAMRDTVIKEFSGYTKRVAAKKLANWLIHSDGHNMSYRVDANYTPIEAFNNREGNCLSFTILLSRLAKELDIDIQYNEVDLPDVWDFNESSGMVLYRHVNGVMVSPQQRQIFDLAIENYDFGYPQRIVPEQLAVAKLHSNIAMQHLSKDRLEKALHSIKLAISHAPENSDLWINLGVLFKRQNKAGMAELAYLYGYELDSNNAMAASNLERLYRSQGRSILADKYELAAQRARQRNPYFHYEVAKNLFEELRFTKARKAIRKAIKLHNSDARFYVLSSRISQRRLRFDRALKDLEKAYALAVNLGDRDRYVSKARRVNQKLLEQEQERQKRRSSRSAFESRGNS